MNLVDLYNFFKGYVTVRITGYQLERFLNMSVNQNIYFWNLKKISDTEMTLNISIKGFKKLRRTALKTKTKMKIIRRSGAYKYIKKAKRRKIFFVTLISCFVLLFLITSFILDIEVIGNNTVSKELILEKLSEINLKRFKLRSNINSDKISLKLINEIDNIIWVGVYENGTKLIIEIKERKMPPPIVPLDKPCHLVAKKDAVVLRMNIENGEPTVKLNQVVSKGQILVSGILNTKLDGQRYVHSMGEVIGKTWHEDFLEIKNYEYQKQYTGKQKSKTILKVTGKEFDLSFGKVIPFFNSDENTKRTVIGFLEFEKKVYSEYLLNKVPITWEQAIESAKAELAELLKKEYSEDMIKSIEFQDADIDEETKRLRILAQIEEQIAEVYEIQKGE